MGDLVTLEKEVRMLTGYVQTLAKAMLEKHDPFAEEEGGMPGMEEDPMNPGGGMPGMEEDPMALMPGMHKEDPAMDSQFQEDPMGAPGGMPGMEEDPMNPGGMPGMPGEEEMPYDEDEMAMAYYKARRMQKLRVQKGWRHAAKNTAEHDGPFSEKDSTVEGNETQPAGDQGGDREDESFGVGGQSSRAYAGGSYKALATTVQALKKQIGDLTANGQVISKALVPPVTAHNPQDAGPDGQILLTREMQEQAKNQSYRQLNKLRIEVGDLPTHGIFGS